MYIYIYIYIFLSFFLSFLSFLSNSNLGMEPRFQIFIFTSNSNPGMEPRSPALQVDSLPSEPPGKPKNTGVGSLSLLQ